jgi:hypothetical protein
VVLAERKNAFGEVVVCYFAFKLKALTIARVIHWGFSPQHTCLMTV